MNAGGLGNDPAVSDAIDAVANARNESYLLMDARMFVHDGTHPDDLPTTRRYKWPYPEERPDGGKRSYKSALKFVLKGYYDEHGYPECDTDADGGEQ